MYEACNCDKSLVLIDNAGHGISYLVDPELYVKELEKFFNEKVFNK